MAENFPSKDAMLASIRNVEGAIENLNTQIRFLKNVVKDRGKFHSMETVRLRNQWSLVNFVATNIDTIRQSVLAEGE